MTTFEAYTRSLASNQTPRHEAAETIIEVFGLRALDRGLEFYDDEARKPKLCHGDFKPLGVTA